MAHLSPSIAIAVAVGILVTALFLRLLMRRARLLFAFALLLVVGAVLVTKGPTGLRLGTHVGLRTWTPTSVGQIAHQFRFDAGAATLDLRSLHLPPSGSPYRVRSTVGFGQLKVIAPVGESIRVHATVGLGRVAVDGLPEQSGPRATVSEQVPGVVVPGVPTIDLVVAVSVGNLEVSRG
ncbi:MAG: hypothetical protein WC005_04350 [Candidatus Nanopelagicales bacterium]